MESNPREYRQIPEASGFAQTAFLAHVHRWGRGADRERGVFLAQVPIKTLARRTRQSGRYFN